MSEHATETGGGVESGAPAAEHATPTSPPGLAGLLLGGGLVTGLLVGMTEVVWSYLLPRISSQWQAVLPADLPGLGAFLLAALVTDGTLGLLLGLLLLGVARLLRIRRTARGPGWLLTPLLAGGMCYLYVGWIVLFVLLPVDRRTLTYQAIVFVGVTLLVTAAWLLSRTILANPRRGRWIAAALAAGLGLLVAVGFAAYRASLPTETPLAPTPGGPRPNVLLITLDTLRADYVGCYGHPWIETPTLDRLAGEGVRFSQTVAQAPSTTPSHCSLMTSVYPFVHEAHNGKPMRPELVTLADVLAANGYETVAFTSATTTRSINSGLNRGFERYVDSLVPWSELFSRDEFQHLIFFYALGIVQHSQIPGGVVTDRALRWFGQRSERPFFAWLHYFDPHDPYGSPPPFRGKYTGRCDDGLPLAAQRERYAEDISYVDNEVGRVIAALEAAGELDNTLVLVTSDHGEAFGERHGAIVEKKHGRWLYDTTQLVPWIVRMPAGDGAGRSIATQAELVDVPPTVLGLLEIPSPDSFIGTDFAPQVSGRAADTPSRAAYAFNVIDIQTGDSERDVSFVQQIAVREPDWKFITIPRTQANSLFDLRTDPGETRSVIGANLAALEKWKRLALEHYDPTRDVNLDPRQRVAPSLVRQLQSLGYLGGDDE